MKSIKLSLQETGQFSNLFLDYLDGEEKLAPFYERYPSLDQFKEQLQAKAQSYSHRQILVEVLNRQHASIQLHQKAAHNLQKLQNDTCFTITTGHQLCLATGPMYFIYKIMTAVRLAEDLKIKYPDNEFVPVFWMATEDHDLEEINHFHLFGKKYEWQTSGKGASGKVSTEGFRIFFDTIPDCPSWIIKAYCESKNLADATRALVNHLFSEYGVLIVDGDDKTLKSLFVSQIKEDLIGGKYSPLVRATSQKLEEAGYKVQAFVRDHNFFYLGQGFRERIETVNSERSSVINEEPQANYQVVNTDIRFSEEELRRLIQEQPELFSPNVLLRPLYQETILPNLAYIGGPGELAYWFQLKGIFGAENIPFPILFPRKFATIIPQNVKEKLAVSGIEIADLFLTEDYFKGLLLEKLQVEKFDFQEETALIEALKEHLHSKATKADKSLVLAVEAEIAKATKGISDLEKRLNKALENRHETDLNKLQNIRKKLFPEGGLQERYDNFLNFYINNPALISDLHKSFDPFLFQMECFVG